MFFTSSNSKYIDGMLFVPVTFPYNIPDALLIENLKFNQLIEYCNRKCIRKVFIQGMQDFNFLTDCDSIEHIAIELRLPFDAYAKQKSTVIPYDLTPLESMPYLKSIDIREDERYGSRARASIDLSKIMNLEAFYGDYKFAHGLESASRLKTLQLSRFKQANMSVLKKLSDLDTVSLSFSDIENMDGIQWLSNLQCLYLSYNRKLNDISLLRYAKDSLRALRIENCPRIHDFSVLRELRNLELLELSGNNVLDNLSFLPDMPMLKTFIFSMNVLDGDLSWCKNLQWVYSERNRRHYNLRDDDLPKIMYLHGNSEVDEWRRLE